MTTVNALIGDTDVSSRIKRIEVARKATEGIGRWGMLLDNHDNIFNEVFAENAYVNIKANNSTLMNGYLDKLYPEIVGKYMHFMNVIGRDVGQDLMNKTATGVYNDAADEIIQAFLAAANSEITFSAPGTAPIIYVDGESKPYHTDVFRELLELIDYDGFVDSEKVWNMFPIGSISSEIALKSLKEDLSNNILNVISLIESDAVNVRNYIMVKGGQVDDSWTEFNAADWTPDEYYGDADQVISDYTATNPTTVRSGVAAIKVAKDYVSFLAIKVDFPKFNLPYIDFSKLAGQTLSFNYYGNNCGNAIIPQIYLIDTEDNMIRYIGEGTVAPWIYSNVWYSCVRPVGIDQTIADAPVNGQWYYISKVTAFNWRIKTLCIGISPSITATGYVLLDSLKLPQQIWAISDQSAGSPYKKRDRVISRTDLSTQVELDAYAVAMCEKLKLPLKVLTLKAIGNTGFINGSWRWLPGYTATVNIPDLNIVNRVWRFIEITHAIDRENLVSGFDHTVTLSMVPQYAKLNTLTWSYAANTEVGIIRALRDRLRYLEYVQPLVAPKGAIP